LKTEQNPAPKLVFTKGRRTIEVPDLEIRTMATRQLGSKDFKRQLSGYGLTTAQILYRRPDHPWLLQTYIWQNYDLFPKFPELQRFLAFWVEKLEGPLHSVTVAHCRLIKPAELRAIGGEFRLH
jgi:uncharacterized protein Usg